MKLSDVVVVSALRTPMGRFGGSLKEVPSYQLGAAAMGEAVKHAGFDGCDIDEVIFGSCRQAGNGPNPARSAALLAGIPSHVPAMTVNMACPSGMKTVMLAAEGILAGQGTVYVVGGMDSMSTIPYLLKGARFEGFKMGNKMLEDGWSDATDPITHLSLGETAEMLADKHGISREIQDAYALESHRKTVAAMDGGCFKDEVVPIPTTLETAKAQRILEQDESPRRDTSREKLAALPSAFRKDGTVTAGNSSGLTDGACALVVTSRERARGQGTPLFSVVAMASASVESASMGEGPCVSMIKVLEKAKLRMSDIDLFEINEAFAVQVIVNVRTLGIDQERLNVHGGAIALGHPTGVSGARILVTLRNALRTRGKELGLAAICGAGGVTTAMIIRRES